MHFESDILLHGIDGSGHMVKKTIRIEILNYCGRQGQEASDYMKVTAHPCIYGSYLCSADGIARPRIYTLPPIHAPVRRACDGTGGLHRVLTSEWRTRINASRCVTDTLTIEKEGYLEYEDKLLVYGALSVVLFMSACSTQHITWQQRRLQHPAAEELQWERNNHVITYEGMKDRGYR